MMPLGTSLTHPFEGKKRGGEPNIKVKSNLKSGLLLFQNKFFDILFCLAFFSLFHVFKGLMAALNHSSNN